MYEHYSAEDDKRTIAFYIMGGGLIVSFVEGSFIYLIFTTMVTSIILRCLSNIDNNRPVYMPGKHERHLTDSMTRLFSSKPYRGGYRRRIKKSHYY